MTGFWRPLADGVSVAVKVQPKSRRPGLQGTVPTLDGPRLRIGVGEPAEAGRANAAVCSTMARALGLPATAVRVTMGASSREKLLHVDGDPNVLGAKLTGL